MGRLKDFLFDEWEANAHITNQQVHSAFHDALNNIQRQPQRDAERVRVQTGTVYGLYVNGELADVYMHKDAAEFDCWLCQKHDHNSDEPFHYEVKSLLLKMWTLDDIYPTTKENRNE